MQNANFWQDILYGQDLITTEKPGEELSLQTALNSELLI